LHATEPDEFVELRRVQAAGETPAPREHPHVWASLRRTLWRRVASHRGEPGDKHSGKTEADHVLDGDVHVSCVGEEGGHGDVQGAQGQPLVQPEPTPATVPELDLGDGAVQGDKVF
jgi:hypothetical protein